MAAGNEPAVVRQLVADATALLDTTADDIGCSALERIRRLRDEFHVTANRIARFKVDHNPVVDAVRISAPTAATLVLGPAQLLIQLNIEADRLIGLVEQLTPREWLHVGRAGDRKVTLGELVDGVLDRATRDDLETLDKELPHAVSM